MKKAIWGASRRRIWKKAKFTVYGEPKGKGRPRFNTKTGHAITPKDTVSYENLVKLEWQTAYGTESFSERGDAGYED